MVSKKEILTNLREYSSDQIVEAINAGVVTIYELSKSGNLTPLMRKRIEEKIESMPYKVEVQSSSTMGEETLSSNETIPESDDREEPYPYFEKLELVVLPNEEIVEETENHSENVIFRKPFAFRGRIRRLEYGLSFIVFFIWSTIVQAASITPDIGPVLALIMLLSYIPMMWFFWAQGSKRCHDRGNSGWYQFIPFYVFVMIFGEGDNYSNEYGESPKVMK